MDRVRELADNNGLDDSDIKEFTGEFASGIHDRLIDGLLGGYNIDGKQFKSLAKSTIANRRNRLESPTTSTRPLIDRPNVQSILNFLQSDKLMQVGKLQIKLNKPGQDYMLAQNEGFITPKGGSVPARKWYGIPKTYKEGGVKYNELLEKFVKKIEKNFEKILKFT